MENQANIAQLRLGNPQHPDIRITLGHPSFQVTRIWWNLTQDCKQNEPHSGGHYSMTLKDIEIIFILSTFWGFGSLWVILLDKGHVFVRYLGL